MIPRIIIQHHFPSGAGAFLEIKIWKFQGYFVYLPKNKGYAKDICIAHGVWNDVFCWQRCNVFKIDYVRVYSYDAATKGFTMLWQDDFNGEDLDPEHWDRGNWEMERVNLRPDNVLVENGVCRLILDYEAN